MDADTLVSPNLLRAFAARLDAGAAAVQARYGVRNPDASWRTRLMAIAFALFHDLRSLGRERLGLSAGLRGNGMCFSTRLLREVPHQAFSVVEDLEYGLAPRAGGPAGPLRRRGLGARRDGVRRRGQRARSASGGRAGGAPWSAATPGRP